MSRLKSTAEYPNINKHYGNVTAISKEARAPLWSMGRVLGGMRALSVGISDLGAAFADAGC